MAETATPAPPADPGSLEAAINAGLDTSTSDNPAGDLLTDFAAELTQDLPVQKPGDPKPVAKEDPPKKEDTTPAAETQTEESDEEKIPELPASAAKATRESWDKLRARGDKYKTQVAEKDTAIAERDTRLKAVEAELADLRSKAAKVPEYEEQLKELKAIEADMAVYKIESTPEYKKAITEPFKALDTAIDTLVKSNEGTDVDAFFRMVQEADPAKQRAAFKELTSGWDQVDQAEGWGMVKSARELFDKQDLMRANANAAAKEREELAAKSAAAAKETARNEFKAATSDAVKSMREKIPFTPIADGETEDDRYTRLTDKLAAVDFDSQSPRSKAFAAAAALELPNLIKANRSLLAKVAELEARVSKTNNFKPKSEGKVDPAPPAAGDDDNLFDISEPAARLSHSIPVVQGG